MLRTIAQRKRRRLASVVTLDGPTDAAPDASSSQHAGVALHMHVVLVDQGRIRITYMVNQ
jgi:hypothetical protein